MEEPKEISEHVHARFGMRIREVKAIDKGWLNVKWRMETEDKAVFVDAALE